MSLLKSKTFLIKNPDFIRSIKKNHPLNYILVAETQLGNENLQEINMEKMF